MEKQGQDSVGILNAFNISLIFISVSLAAYIIVAIFVLKPDRNFNSVLQAPSQGGIGSGEILSLPEPVPFDQYNAIIASRDIFQVAYPRGGRPSKIPGAANQTTSGSIELLRDFKLVGIILDQKPQAVFEDLKNKQTIFLSIGESLGDAVLEEVLDGKVVFLHQNRHVEITP